MNQRVANLQKKSRSKTTLRRGSWGFALQLNAKQRLLAISFLVVLVLSFLFSLVIGVYPIPVKMVISGVFGAELPSTESFLVWQVRLPRALMAALVGAGLSTAGAAMQGLFQNPLADPGLIGVSSGAMLFAAIGIVALPDQITNLWPWLSPFTVAIAAFIGSVITTVIVFRFATIHGRTSVQLMLLAGLAISALASAGTGFLSYLSNDQELRDLTLWFLGSVGSTQWIEVWIILPVILISTISLLGIAHPLDLMALGEEGAQHSGVDTNALKNRIILFTALAVGVSVALCGVISFVALIVPHLVRTLAGPTHRSVLLLSTFLGAGLLVLADLLARSIQPPAELPIGVLTALIGVPFFLWILRGQKEVFAKL